MLTLKGVLLIFVGSVLLAKTDALNTDWTGWGGNYFNNRYASQGSLISSSNIQSLSPHCQIPYPVYATPVTLASTAYFPTGNGSFLALDINTCHILWHINVTAIIENYAPITAIQAANTFAGSRTSPQIDGNVVYFGTQPHALLIAVDRFTGSMLDIIQISPHPLAILTMSPTSYNGQLFIGTASMEEAAGYDLGYKFSFVGSMVALSFDFETSKFVVNWNISMIPPAEATTGRAGASLWGSQPAIDVARGQLFIATGNSYSVPQVITDCEAASQNITAVLEGLVPEPCLPKDIWQESVLAIDIELGVVNWVQQLPPLDAWTLACGLPGYLAPNPAGNCPPFAGEDADFGMAPTFVPGSSSTPYGKDTVVIGQKNGILHALSAQSGTPFWSVSTSPGSSQAGLSWGIAVDDTRVYFTAINGLSLPWTLLPGNQKANNSGYGAANLKDGTLLWEVAAPGGYDAYGPPSVVGDLVVVAKSGLGLAGVEGVGSLLALDRESGALVAEFDLDSTFHSGVAVVGDKLLFGTGYYSLDGSLYVMQIP